MLNLRLKIDHTPALVIHILYPTLSFVYINRIKEISNYSSSEGSPIFSKLEGIWHNELLITIQKIQQVSTQVLVLLLLKLLPIQVVQGLEDLLSVQVELTCRDLAVFLQAAAYQWVLLGFQDLLAFYGEHCLSLFKYYLFVETHSFFEQLVIFLHFNQVL